ncbi:MAG: helix-turn-helix domain-containing protein [Acidobacteria bacterium]|nr:helix-turn-helix domain-containing protein [Acidobacteriota bacterium]MBI3421647.1 helix-turn-helix domain-containing protein [Acidobacteriota bacterium]
MNRKRRIEITVEKTLLIVRRTSSLPVWCPACPAPAQLITPETAAALLGVSTRTLYRKVEAGQFHFVETAEGKLLVCPNSLITATP